MSTHNNRQDYRVVSNNVLHFSSTAQRSDYAIRLDYNEFPYSPPWLQDHKDRTLNLYPEDENSGLLENIAQIYQLPVSEIAVTHGVDEALDRFAQLFQKHSFALFDPTFYAFEERLLINDANVRHFKLTPSLAISPSDVQQITKNDIVILASPSNPTGHLFADSEIESLLDAAYAVLVDETYIDFSSSTGWLSKRPNNMFIYRSFSKSFGLAGLRAGFLVGPKQEMEEIRSKQWFCNMSSPVIYAINQALASDWQKEFVQTVVHERMRLVNELKSMRFEVMNTETNFILLKDTFGTIDAELKQNNICVKQASALGLSGYLRISVGTPDTNNLLLKALKPLSLAHFENEEVSPKACVNI